MHSHQIPNDQVLSFMCAGNATFTFKGLTSGKHYTFNSLFKEKFGKKYIEIKYLNGPDNTSNYGYLCCVESDDTGIPKITFVKSSLQHSVPFKAFSFVFMCLLTDMDMPKLEVWHEGKCCRCGRKLTVPESIQNGIGPECIDKINKFKIAI